MLIQTPKRRLMKNIFSSSALILLATVFIMSTTADLADQVIPKGVQVAGPLDAASLSRVDVSGAPIYADSPAAKEYKPPFG